MLLAIKGDTLIKKKKSWQECLICTISSAKHWDLKPLLISGPRTCQEASGEGAEGEVTQKCFWPDRTQVHKPMQGSHPGSDLLYIIFLQIGSPWSPGIICKLLWVCAFFFERGFLAFIRFSKTSTSSLRPFSSYNPPPKNQWFNVFPKDQGKTLPTISSPALSAALSTYPLPSVWRAEGLTCLLPFCSVIRCCTMTSVMLSLYAYRSL